jgi:Sulfotransferase domain
MSENNFIITGCQRSGTTLLKLILDSHSKIKVYDEDEVGFHGENILSFAEKHSEITGYKLPMISNEIDILQKLNYKIIFIVRDPRDTILSMYNLKMDYHLGYDTHKQKSYMKLVKKLVIHKKLFIFAQLFFKLKRKHPVRWIHHAAGIDQELNYTYFEENLKSERNEYLNTHSLIRQNLEAFKLAANVWNFKNTAPEMYEKMGLNYIYIKYEDLLKDLEGTIRKLTNFLDVEFDFNMLNYYKNKKGVSIGNTKNDNPLMNKNTNKWGGFFSYKELCVIYETCQIIADKYSYDLTP